MQITSAPLLAASSDCRAVVERIWRREGLKVPQKQPKKGRLWLNDGSCVRLRPERPNHAWSYEFVQDRSHDGRIFRTLNFIDEFTKEAGGKPTVHSLKRPPYVLDAHPVGMGFATRSKAGILTVYDEKLEIDFETDLSTTPEVEANRKRFDLDGAGAGPVLWGEAHLALNWTCRGLMPLL
jgi:hypothetical protein